MKFETFEPRLVFDQTLATAIQLNLDTVVEVEAPAPETAEIPTDIDFHPIEEDFRFSSDDLDPAQIDDFIRTTEEWQENPNNSVYDWSIDEDNDWWKPYSYNPISVHGEGYLVAERITGQQDVHTMVIVQRPNSDCHTTDGHRLIIDDHYRLSFDIRHPASQEEFLSTLRWSLVAQIWGPGTAGSSLNPPFGIYAMSTDGQPEWVIQSRGDSRLDTTRPYEEEREVRIPMTDIGEWHNWDVEYVPNSFGDGLVRVWLDGELVADWVDVKSSYHGVSSRTGETLGPISPALGNYSYTVGDGHEAHFDNVVMQCTGSYESSIAGRVTGVEHDAGNIVFATNQETGARYGVETEKNGVYTLAIPRGVYTVTAVDAVTGNQTYVNDLSTLGAPAIIADIEVEPPPPAPAVAQEAQTFTGDVTGDGTAEIVNFLADGTWQVTDVSGATAETETSVWSTWSTDVEWNDVMLADFNGDGRQDVAGRTTDGHWFVGVSTGSGFQNQHWGKWSAGVEWDTIQVGDFNGDNMADIAGRAASDGSWWVAESNGEAFLTTSWGRWSNDYEWEVVVGDFNGDGIDDLAGRNSADGSIWVGQSTGDRFVNEYWGRFSETVEWSEFQVGDFNGDGMTDIVARAKAGGTWWVAESTGDAFVNRYYGRWNTDVYWVDIQVVDVDGDGLSDIVGRAASDNSWWFGRSTGQEFQTQHWGSPWANNVDWSVAIADDFDGDGKSDLLGATSGDDWLISI